MSTSFNQSGHSYDFGYLGSTALSQVGTGLGSLQKPLRELYCPQHTPDGGLQRLPWARLVIQDRGLMLSTSSGVQSGHSEQQHDTFFEMSSVVLWDVVQFVVTGGTKKDKKVQCAFEPLQDLAYDRAKYNLFAPLDKKFRHLEKAVHPVLFTCVLRRPSGVRALDLHVFQCVSGQQARSLTDHLSAAHASYAHDEASENGSRPTEDYRRAALPTAEEFQKRYADSGSVLGGTRSGEVNRSASSAGRLELPRCKVNTNQPRQIETNIYRNEPQDYQEDPPLDRFYQAGYDQDFPPIASDLRNYLVPSPMRSNIVRSQTVIGPDVPMKNRPLPVPPGKPQMSRSRDQDAFAQSIAVNEDPYRYDRRGEYREPAVRPDAGQYYGFAEGQREPTAQEMYFQDLQNKSSYPEESQYNSRSVCEENPYQARDMRRGPVQEDNRYQPDQNQLRKKLPENPQPTSSLRQSIANSRKSVKDVFPIQNGSGSRYQDPIQPRQPESRAPPPDMYPEHEVAHIRPEVYREPVNRPVAMVEPRKIYGIQVLPNAADIPPRRNQTKDMKSGKSEGIYSGSNAQARSSPYEEYNAKDSGISSYQSSNSNAYSSRDKDNKSSAMSYSDADPYKKMPASTNPVESRHTTVPDKLSSEPQNPKEAEIASAFQNMNFDSFPSNTVSSHETDFEKSLGYFP